MKTPSLRAVGARIEEAYKLLPGEPTDAEDAYSRLEAVCVAVLDSEHADFVPGELQEYLHTLLYKRQLELGLIPFPDPREE